MEKSRFFFPHSTFLLSFRARVEKSLGFLWRSACVYRHFKYADTVPRLTGQSVEFIEALMLTLRNYILQVLANVASCNVHATRSEDYYKLPYAPSARIH